MSDHTAMTVFEGANNYSEALTIFLNQPWGNEMEQTIAMRAQAAQACDEESARYHIQQIWGMYAGAFHNNVSDVFLHSFNALNNWPRPEQAQGMGVEPWSPSF